MSDDDRLYRLLPAVLRQRDHAQGEPLRALMRVFAAELRVLERETETVYDDWFIETCSEWLVPYIGEALGVRGLRPLTATGFSTRAFVGNLLDHRRRKGTASELEQLGRDLTRHGSVVEEYFARLVVSPHLQHVRQGAHTAQVRDPGPLEHLGGPFGTDARTPDVRSIERHRSMRPSDVEHGLWNIPHVGLHLFTLQSRPIVRAEARAIAGEPGWYRFDPLSRDTVLFSRPYPEADIDALAGPEHVARALSRLELAQEERGDVPMRWLGPNAVVRVRLRAGDGTEQLFSAAEDRVRDNDGGDVPDPEPLVVLDPETALPRLRIAHLADLRAGGLPTRRPRHPEIVHVDPENGRLVFHPDALDPAPEAVLVDYQVGHASPLGAGPWDRTSSVHDQLEADGIVLADVDAHWGVHREDADGAEVFADLDQAIDAWNAFVAAEGPEVTGLITVMDSRLHPRTSAPTIQLPIGARLVIVAGDWPRVDIDGVPTRVRGTVDPNNRRPTILGELAVQTDPTLPSTSTRPGGLWLNGLLLEEGVRVRPGTLERLSLRHCTTATLRSGVRVDVGDPSTSNTTLELDVTRCVLGSLRADGPTRVFRATDSVLHGRTTAFALPEAHVHLQGCTLLGTTAARVFEASDCIFSETVDAEHTQQGCIRYSFVPPGSHTPRRYRCQPDLALADTEDPTLRQRIVARVRPVWTTLDPALPAYAQLAQACPVELRRGAEDGLEMGVFFHLQLPWREDNLRTMLRQFLRHGLDAGLRYEN